MKIIDCIHGTSWAIFFVTLFIVTNEGKWSLGSIWLILLHDYQALNFSVLSEDFSELLFIPISWEVFHINVIE